MTANAVPRRSTSVATSRASRSCTLGAIQPEWTGRSVRGDPSILRARDPREARRRPPLASAVGAQPRFPARASIGSDARRDKRTVDPVGRPAPGCNRPAVRLGRGAIRRFHVAMDYRAGARGRAVAPAPRRLRSWPRGRPGRPKRPSPVCSRRIGMRSGSWCWWSGSSTPGVSRSCRAAPARHRRPGRLRLIANGRLVASADRGAARDRLPRAGRVPRRRAPPPVRRDRLGLPVPCRRSEAPISRARPGPTNLACWRRGAQSLSLADPAPARQRGLGRGAESHGTGETGWATLARRARRLSGAWASDGRGLAIRARLLLRRL
jgi:hypothetical protein